MSKVNLKENKNNNQQIINLTLLLKEKEQEVRIAKQKAGFFARKHAELAKMKNTSQQKS